MDAATVAGAAGSRRLGLLVTPSGRKTVMAITGIVLLMYVVVHMIGNLKLFAGASSFNGYADWLRELGEPLLPRSVLLWVVRLMLAAAFVLHVYAAAGLARHNRRNRAGYRTRRQWAVASYASRTMPMSGIIVGLFVLFHLLDLTWGQANPRFVRGDAYANVVASLERWPLAVVYVVANVALGLHIAHGVWSATQTLGADGLATERVRRGVATALAGVIVVGNVSIPIAIQAGWVG